jgi:hypothetical protein
VAVIVLLVLFVGVAVPVLLQLRRTLTSAQAFLDTARPQFEKTLEDLTVAAERIQHVAASVEDRVEQAREILATGQQLAGQVGRVGSALRTVTAIGGAVGPAVLAAARAFFIRSGSQDESIEESGRNDGE